MIYLILPLLFIVSEQDTTEVDSILTNTVICIQEDDLKWTPIPELLSQQIGIVWYHGQLHFRGGRAGEVVYLVDGVDVTDLVSGIPYITCNNEAISKMWVALDGFDIEYGNAMSGVVNIITKEGGDYYSGDLIYSNGIEYGEHRLNLNLGGPLRIIKNMNIFLSGSMYQTDDYSPSILAKSNNKLRDLNGMAKLVWNPNPFLKLTLKGDILSENYHIYDHSRSRAGWSEDFPLYKSRYSSILLSVSQNLSTNVSYILKAGILNSSLNASSQNGKHYNNWKAIGVRLPWVSLARDSGWYDPEKRRWSDGWSEEKAWMWYYDKIANYGYWNTNTGEWQWTGEDSLQKLWHAIKALNNRYYETNEWMFTEDSSNIYYHKFDLYKFIEDIKRYYNDSTFTTDSIEPSGNMYYIRYNYDEFCRFNYNFLPFWYEEENSDIFLDFSLNYRLGRFNNVKLGGSFKRYNLSSTKIEFINQNPYVYTYEGRPSLLAVYLSDKVNYKEFSINAGIRFDNFNPRVDDVNPKNSFSPRIGVAFTPTPSSVIYCNCGKFVQFSGVDYAYSNIDTNLYANNIVGNPDLPWEETMTYAIGMKYKIFSSLYLNASLYRKDVKNLLRYYKINTIWRNKLVTFMTFDDSDGATIYGADLGIGWQAYKYLNWIVSYSYLNAEGTVEYSSWYLSDIKEWLPLEWDITHSLALNLNLSLPSDFGSELGLFKPLANLNTTLRFIYTSAFPFDSTDVRGLFIGIERSYDNFRMDMRLKKDFWIVGVKFGLFVEIWNLFDRENIINVYSYTGKPDNDGNPPRWDPVRYESIYENDPYINRKYESAYDFYLADCENWKDYCNKPNHYDIPRIIRFGVTTSF